MGVHYNLLRTHFLVLFAVVVFHVYFPPVHFVDRIKTAKQIVLYEDTGRRPADGDIESFSSYCPNALYAADNT